MAEIEFIFNSIKTTIQCNINEKMKNICKRLAMKINKDINEIYFIYDGNKLNENLLELTFIENAKNIDKERKKMNLLVYEINIKTEKNKRVIKEIICPECDENFRININNYKIQLFGCKNKHNIYMNIKEFEKSQYTDESIIKAINVEKIINQILIINYFIDVLNVKRIYVHYVNQSIMIYII